MSTTLTIARPQRLGWIAGGALVSVIGALLLAPALSPVRAQTTDEATKDHTLSVTGTGIVTVEPDTADITVGVTVTARPGRCGRLGCREHHGCGRHRHQGSGHRGQGHPDDVPAAQSGL